MVTTKTVLREFGKALLHWHSGFSFLLAIGRLLSAVCWWPEMTWLSAISWLWPLAFIAATIFACVSASKRAINSYIENSPELRSRYRLWELTSLFVEACDESRRGGFSAEKQRNWVVDVERHLEAWDPRYLKRYQSYVDTHTPFPECVERLEEVLVEIMDGFSLGKL